MTDPMKKEVDICRLIRYLGRVWYTLPAISVKVRESLVQFPGDCTKQILQILH